MSVFISDVDMAELYVEYFLKAKEKSSWVISKVGDWSQMGAVQMEF